MKAENFLVAIQIIAECHTSKIIINKVLPNGQVSPVLDSPTIHIKHCCAGVINRLKEANFTVSMFHGLMSIEDYTRPRI
jgi:hypothetical protein